VEKRVAQGFFLKNLGPSYRAFELEEFALSELLPGEVCLKVEAFGLNFADVMARNGRYRDAPKIPFIPGYDVVGEVVQSGSKENDFWLGKRVVAFCRFGGYATLVNTQVDGLLEIGNIPAGTALALCTQGVTASYMSGLIHPTRKNGLVLVHAAAGGVGSLLLQLLHARGFETIAKVGTYEKAQRIQALAPTEVLVVENSDYRKELARILQNRTLAASFNATGGKSIRFELPHIGPGGSLVLFGGAALLENRNKWMSLIRFVINSGFASPIPLMVNSRGIIGVNMLRLADDQPELLAEHLRQCFMHYEQGRLIPLPAIQYASSQLAEAHALLESGKSVGKVMVYWAED